MLLNLISILGLCFVLIACGGSSDDKGAGSPVQKANYVKWESVSSEFNPSLVNYTFNTEGSEKINLEAFGSDKDAQVVYSSDTLASQVGIRQYKVWKKYADGDNLTATKRTNNLDLKSYGRYQCSIKVENGQITALEGGCYVRTIIYLPVGSEIEVYNHGDLITKRFIPIDNKTFLDQLDNASFSKDKFLVIEKFLASYTGSKIPVLTTAELAIAIREFITGKEKLSVLTQLHGIISDREKLSAMIDIEFIFFDREEARRITGL